jgi:hypothetical protein
MASIGIVNGQPFKPDDRHRQILDKAAKAAVNMAGALNISSEVLAKRLGFDPLTTDRIRRLIDDLLRIRAATNKGRDAS